MDFGRRKGFTFLEIMIVIALVAIIFALGIPNYNRFRRLQATKSAAAAFQAEVRKAKQTAETMETYTYVVFTTPDDIGRVCYWTVVDKEGDGPDDNMTRWNTEDNTSGGLIVGPIDVYEIFLGTTIAEPETDSQLGFGPDGRVDDDTVSADWSKQTPVDEQSYWYVTFKSSAADQYVYVRIYKNGSVEIEE